MLEDYAEKNGFTGIRHFTDDDFLPFRDVINEYYAKDISKKIKSTCYTILYNQYEGEQEQLQNELDGYRTEQKQYEK